MSYELGLNLLHIVVLVGFLFLLNDYQRLRKAQPQPQPQTPPQQNNPITIKACKEDTNQRPMVFDVNAFSEHVNNYQTLTHRIAKAKGWHNKKRNEGEILALIHSEVSEALEVLRLPDRDFQDPSERKDFLGEELADVVIRTFDFAALKNIDLSQKLYLKMLKNLKRPVNHGGKRF